jgi:hypothetical protein
MSKAVFRSLLPPAIVLLLTGCAAQGEFPSLAPRPIELGTGQASTPVAATPSLPSDPRLLARVNEAVTLATTGMAAFDAALSSARSAANASDGNRGSERWIAAQMALSQLERMRSPAATAMADLDDARRVLLSGTPSVDVPAIETAWAKVQDIYQSQLEASQAVAATVNRR